jgi:hypothetical protein
VTTVEKDRRPPAPEDDEQDTGAYEDAWYRTMKVRAARSSEDETTDHPHEPNGQDPA